MREAPKNVDDTLNAFWEAMQPHRVDVPVGVMAQILDRLQVPEHRWANEVGFLTFLFTYAAGVHRFREMAPMRLDAAKQLARVAKMAAALRLELGKLSDTAKYWFEQASGGSADPDSRREHYERSCSIVDGIYAASTHDCHFAPKRAGGQSKAVGGTNLTPLDHLVCSLWIRADRFGWHLTISPHNRTGTLLDLLNLLRPHLPGVIPNQLDLKRLQRLRGAVREVYDDEFMQKFGQMLARR